MERIHEEIRTLQAIIEVMAGQAHLLDQRLKHGVPVGSKDIERLAWWLLDRSMEQECRPAR